MSPLLSLDDLIEREERVFLARQPASAARTARAERVLAGGATSSWMISRPSTVWMSHGRGSRMWDVDGTEYVDLHGGYGVMLVGHAHPAITDAVQRRIALGSHFAQPTDDAIGGRPKTSRRASGSHCGGSATAAPRRRWTRSI